MSEEILECEDCLTMDETVKHRECPYAKEISGAIVCITVCHGCYIDRSMEMVDTNAVSKES